MRSESIAFVCSVIPIMLFVVSLIEPVRDQFGSWIQYIVIISMLIGLVFGFVALWKHFSQKTFFIISASTLFIWLCSMFEAFALGLIIFLVTFIYLNYLGRGATEKWFTAVALTIIVLLVAPLVHFAHWEFFPRPHGGMMRCNFGQEFICEEHVLLDESYDGADADQAVIELRSNMRYTITIAYVQYAVEPSREFVNCSKTIFSLPQNNSDPVGSIERGGKLKFTCDMAPPGVDIIKKGEKTHVHFRFVYGTEDMPLQSYAYGETYTRVI